MKRTKILILVVILIWGVVWFLGATGEKEKVAAEKGPVTLKLWKAGTETIWHDYFIEAMKRFEAKNPNIRFEYAEAPFGQEIDTKLNVGYASGTAPDIIAHAIVSMASRVEKKQYEPLDAYFAKFEEKDKLIDSMFEFAEYRGKLYGMPYYPVPELYAYRKDFFIEAGLDPEKPPTNWEELSDYAVKLTKRQGDMVVRSGFTLAIDEFKYLVVFSRQNDAQNIGPDNTPAFDNPEMVETLEYFTDLIRNKKVSAEVTKKQEDTLGLFFQSKSAMSATQPSFIGKMIHDNPSIKDKLGFMDIKRKRGGVWSGMGFIYMSSESKHKDEGWDFMKFISSKDETWLRYKAVGCPVVRKDLYDQYVSEDPFLNLPLQNSIKVGVGAPKVPWVPLYLFKYLPQAQQEAFYGKKTPEQALKDAVRMLKDELALTK